MANFDIAVERLFKLEGLHSNDPDDPGGPTNWGISSRQHGIIKSKAEAKEIYRHEYWAPIMGCASDIPQVACNILLDSAVLSGVNTSVRMAQKACNIHGTRLKVDGVAGPLTRGALEHVGAVSWCCAFRTARIDHFIFICDKNPNLRKFFFGWVRRALTP